MVIRGFNNMGKAGESTTKKSAAKASAKVEKASPAAKGKTASIEHCDISIEHCKS